MATDANNELDFDAIIHEVAQRHNVLLTSDDPVLITATLNQIVLQSLTKNSNKALEDLQIKLEEMYFRHHDHTKKIATNMINATITTAGETITEVVEVSKIELSESIGRELDLFIAQCSQQTDINKKIKNVTLIAAVVGITCVLTTLSMLSLSLI